MNEALARLGEYPQVAAWVLEGNDRAVSFYRSLGFAFDGCEKTFMLGTPATEKLMVLVR